MGKCTRLEETKWALIICGVTPNSVWQKIEKAGAANLWGSRRTVWLKVLLFNPSFLAIWKGDRSTDLFFSASHFPPYAPSLTQLWAILSKWKAVNSLLTGRNNFLNASTQEQNPCTSRMLSSTYCRRLFVGTLVVAVAGKEAWCWCGF